jgi:hypothetical protein
MWLAYMSQNMGTEAAITVVQAAATVLAVGAAILGFF